MDEVEGSGGQPHGVARAQAVPVGGNPFDQPPVARGVGARCGIPPFYVSFVLAPLASNASELLANVSYAKKKTQKIDMQNE